MTLLAVKGGAVGYWEHIPINVFVTYIATREMIMLLKPCRMSACKTLANLDSVVSV